MASNNANSEASSCYEDGAISIRNKVSTEWTQELHDKFMVAVRSLGTGSMQCYNFIDFLFKYSIYIYE